ncbi:MAG TPA: neutral zinc metallopeptidase [Vicinamibacterales bacterium]|jgi:predicted metalloprotease|nr:neutral zinc metallopeptidase [Vicinamibacterales bacterium]
MRWTAGDRGNIDDQRGRRVVGAAPLGIGGLLVLAALSYFTGTDFLSMFGDTAAPTSTTTSAPSTTPEEERIVDFVDAVAGDTQDTWSRALGGRYERTQVTLFRDVVQSACGTAESATGPFYCPADHKVYLDLGFFKELSDRFGAPGDFAQAYVIAHEFGHHVQNLLGTNEQVRLSPAAGANSASVALELQADCYAGVWGHDASQAGRFNAGHVELDPGDAEEALRAAAAIGDDRLQKMATGRVAPERFTHGTSEQRMQWFNRGMQSGDPAQCDTFGRGR